MKIAQIAPPWITIPPKHYGGTETMLYNLIEEQIAQGHDVTLLAPGDAQTSARLVSFFPRSLLEDGFPWEAHLKAYYHLHQAIEYIKDHDFDIVHTHLSSAADLYLFPLMAHVAAPHVTTLHSQFPFDRVQGWTGDADELYMQWASSMPTIVISEHVRTELAHFLKVVGVVHHGLPLACFQASVKQPANFFVWLGRFVPEKGAHLAIAAAKNAGVALVLAGTIDQNVQEAVAYFEQAIKPHIDDKQIKYIGPVNMQQKIDLFSRARGFLNPIQWEEPFGMVMIEAMAVGCPVITFNRGAAPEIVKQQKSGFLVQTVDEMADCIQKIDELDRTIVQACSMHNFTASMMAKKYTALYEKIIASSASKLISGPFSYQVRNTKPTHN